MTLRCKVSVSKYPRTRGLAPLRSTGVCASQRTSFRKTKIGLIVFNTVIHNFVVRLGDRGCTLQCLARFYFLWEFFSILLFICKYQRDLLGPFLLLENQTKMCFRGLERHAL